MKRATIARWIWTVLAGASFLFLAYVFSAPLGGAGQSSGYFQSSRLRHLSAMTTPALARHSAVSPQHPNTPPNGAHLRKQNASDTALCFLRIARPLIATAAAFQHWR
ncbi:MAG TPA: hypothetical protein VN737_17565 [Bryobacteraceae bacterium]|nr:hypothetical protein [Bryobacteraceae bacterium]